MAATYDPTLPTLRDRIRLAVGDTEVAVDPDTGESGAWLPDETYDALIAGADSETAALYASAGAALAKLAQSPTSFGEGGMTVAWGNRVKALTDLVAGLGKQIAASAAGAAGQTVTSRPTRGGTTVPEYRRPDGWQYEGGWN